MHLCDVCHFQLAVIRAWGIRMCLAHSAIKILEFDERLVRPYLRGLVADLWGQRGEHIDVEIDIYLAGLRRLQPPTGGEETWYNE